MVGAAVPPSPDLGAQLTHREVESDFGRESPEGRVGESTREVEGVLAGAEWRQQQPDASAHREASSLRDESRVVRYGHQREVR